MSNQVKGLTVLGTGENCVRPGRSMCRLSNVGCAKHVPSLKGLRVSIPTAWGQAEASNSTAQGGSAAYACDCCSLGFLDTGAVTVFVPHGAVSRHW